MDAAKLEKVQDDPAISQDGKSPLTPPDPKRTSSPSLVTDTMGVNSPVPIEITDAIMSGKTVADDFSTDAIANSPAPRDGMRQTKLHGSEQPYDHRAPEKGKNFDRR